MFRLLQRAGWLGAFGRPDEGTQVSLWQMRLSKTEKHKQFDCQTIPRARKDEANQQIEAAVQTGFGRVQAQGQ